MVSALITCAITLVFFCTAISALADSFLAEDFTSTAISVFLN